MIEFEKINLQQAKERLCLQDIGLNDELHKLDFVVGMIAECQGSNIPSDGLYFTLLDIHHNIKKAIELIDTEIIFKLHEKNVDP